MAFTGMTTGVLYSSTQGDSLTGRYIIDHITWYNQTVSNKTVKIVEKARGGAVFESKSLTSNNPITRYFQRGFCMDGIIIASLGSGKVEIVCR